MVYVHKLMWYYSWPYMYVSVVYMLYARKALLFLRVMVLFHLSCTKVLLNPIYIYMYASPK